MSKNSTDCGCQKQTADGVDVADPRRWFDHDALSWLIGEGIRNMNAVDDKQELAYRRSLELLTRLPETTKALAQILRSVPLDDVSLRWSLLYLLADIGHADSLDVFAATASEPIEPRERDPRACETPRDGEILVRTMAIEGIARIAKGHKEAAAKLFEVIEKQPERAVRIEAIKAILAVAPHEADRLKERLPQDLHFALALQRVNADALAVEHDPKKADVAARVPILGQAKTSPSAHCPTCG